MKKYFIILDTFVGMFSCTDDFLKEKMVVNSETHPKKNRNFQEEFDLGLRCYFERYRASIPIEVASLQAMGPLHHHEREKKR